MKQIYNAPTKQAAKAALKSFADKWEDKYSYAVNRCYDNWKNLVVLFEFALEVRKYTKNKLSFPTDDVVMKSVYLAVREATKNGLCP